MDLTAAYGDFRIMKCAARTMLRDNADRKDAVMIMRRESGISSRIRRLDPNKEACPGKRGRGETGIASGPHLLCFRWSVS
ncbi:MAG: hypothetical protein WBF43_02070 [Methylocella sp.]